MGMKEYRATIGKMVVAVRRWKEHNPEVKPEFKPPPMNIIAGLDEGYQFIAQNEAAKNLCLYVDEQSEKQGTLMQLVGVLEGFNMIANTGVSDIVSDITRE